MNTLEKNFHKKWDGVDIESIPYEQFKEFKEDCFDLYEKTGFLKRFDSPYDEFNEHNGMMFEVVRRATEFKDGEGEVDLESMPVWVVRFENGEEGYCYPEEIAVIEHE
jgi:hypothetical protein